MHNRHSASSIVHPVCAASAPHNSYAVLVERMFCGDYTAHYSKMETHRDMYAERYNMDHRRRGLAVIINNVDFKGKGKRVGSDVDYAQLKETMEFLGFNVETHKNQTVSQMRNIFTSVSEKNHKDADCLVLVILSHGGESVIHGTDGPLLLAEVCGRFNGNLCPSLRGKPKIIFIQACQGDQLDHGVLIEGQQTGPLDTSDVDIDCNIDTGSAPFTGDQQECMDTELCTGDQQECMDTEAHTGDQQEWPHSPPVTIKTYMPKEPDMLVVLSSPPGYVSFRNPCKGSWFMKTLCQELRQCHDDTEIMDLLTRVNYNVAYGFESKNKRRSLSDKKQVPCVMSVLTKKLYLKKK